MPVNDSLNLSNGIIAEVGYKSNSIKTNLYPIFFLLLWGRDSFCICRICFRQIRQIIRQIALSYADDSRPFHHRRPSADLSYICLRFFTTIGLNTNLPCCPARTYERSIWIMAVSPADHPIANRQPDSHIIIPCIWRYGKMDLPKIASDC